MATEFTELGEKVMNRGEAADVGLSAVDRLVSVPVSSEYTDNYMTDDNGQRWVKLQYAQSYANKVSELETELGLLKIAFEQEKRLLKSCEEALIERDALAH